MPVCRLLVLLLGVLALAACSGGPQQPAEPATGPLVLAASSMQEALEQAADAWAAKGNARPVLSFAGTSALVRQVEAGAAADVLVSADEQWMDQLDNGGWLAPGSRQDLAGNALVLVAATSRQGQVSLAPGLDLTPLLGPQGRLAIADPEAVPAGRYGRQALQSLGAWDGVAGRLAVAENVRAALALVARGEAPLGVVYATDARAARLQVRVLGTFPAASHARIVYPLARLAASTHPHADDFAAFLLSAEGQAGLRSLGFTAP